MVYLVTLSLVLELGFLIPNAISSSTGFINTSRNDFNESELRIYYGEVVNNIEEMPWMLSLKDMKSKSDCTGSLVHVLWGITAGHCVGDYSSITDDIMVLAGYENFIQKTSHGQIRRGIFIARHPKYASLDTISDLAVVKVDKPFQLTTYVALIPISGEPWNHKEMNGRKCISAGYGMTETDKSNPKLFKKSVIARHGNNACNRNCFSKLKQKEIICLKGIGDICQGDSGGPLVCGGKLVGVASSSYTDALCKKRGTEKCENAHGVYIFVCRYLAFLSKHVPSAPRKIKGCRIGGKRRRSGVFGSVGDEDSGWDSASIKSSYIVTIFCSQLLFLNYQ